MAPSKIVTTSFSSKTVLALLHLTSFIIILHLLHSLTTMFSSFTFDVQEMQHILCTHQPTIDIPFHRNMSSSTTHLFIFSNLIFYNFFNVINLLNLAYLANEQIHHSIELFHNNTCNLVIRFLWPCYQLRLLAIVLIWCISNLTLAFSSQLLPWWSLSDDDVTLTSTAIFSFEELWFACIETHDEQCYETQLAERRSRR